MVLLRVGLWGIKLIERKVEPKGVRERENEKEGEGGGEEGEKQEGIGEGRGSRERRGGRPGLMVSLEPLDPAMPEAVQFLDSSVP